HAPCPISTNQFTNQIGLLYEDAIYLPPPFAVFFVKGDYKGVLFGATSYRFGISKYFHYKCGKTNIVFFQIKTNMFV
ncbi:hypothetical protein, partial [aff. Roholtiella sp. LEGE 12411]|uniref:hypothetical protein n=1 Tax=aff. Roholtiella sp. LEGE 12411 TaxID=1828822 RepID=UPI001ABC5B97